MQSDHYKHRINTIGGLILLLLTLAAGISVYVIMQQQTETILSKSLETSLRNNVNLFESQINYALNTTRTITTRPTLIDKMQQLVANPGNARVLDEFPKIATSFLPTGITGIAFYDAAGHEVARAGSFSEKHSLRVPLKTNNRAFLHWNEQFFLHTSGEFLNQKGHPIGLVETEIQLPLITAAFTDILAIGKTAEYAVCKQLEDDDRKMDCFLNRTSGKNFSRLARVVDGKALPMNYALNGETGIIYAKDYRREQVVAAYSPVGKLGLGLVLKIDQVELYHPVKERLKFIVPLLGTLILVGIFLLQVLVRPLVRKLVDSEKEARGANVLLRDSEMRSRAVLDNVEEGIVAITEKGVIESFNPAAETIFGYTANEIKGQNVRLLLPEVHREKHDSILKYYLEARDQKFIGISREAIGLRKNGSSFQMEINTSEAKLESGNLFIISVRDIEVRKQTEKKIQQLNLELVQFKNTLDQTLEGVFMFRPDTLRITYVNLGAQRQVGYSEAELLQMTPVDIKPEFTLQQFRKILQPLIVGVQLAHTFQTVHRHKDGHDIPVEIFIQFIHMEGQEARFVAMVSDISERKQAEQRIAHLANHDALTDLPNRNLLHDRIQQALIYAHRNSAQGAVLFIDLDKFKIINDTLGHDVGDLLLKEVAHRLVSCLRSQDTVARYGGDEFIVVLHSVANSQDTGSVAKKLLDALLMPYQIKGNELNISASIGIAVFPDHGTDADMLLTHSDTAMYHAKEAGRNNYKFFAQQLNA
jgi:diguanylate cyclase (GGDEF)-like protein/PAS domain S-box-containing protein